MKVYTFLQHEGHDIAAGTAFINERKGRIAATFSFDETYLSTPGVYQFDPELQLSMGNWPLAHGLPKSFLDSAPHR
jgi:hypothetical protein